MFSDCIGVLWTGPLNQSLQSMFSDCIDVLLTGPLNQRLQSMFSDCIGVLLTRPYEAWFLIESTKAYNPCFLIALMSC